MSRDNVCDILDIVDLLVADAHRYVSSAVQFEGFAYLGDMVVFDIVARYEGEDNAFEEVAAVRVVLHDGGEVVGSGAVGGKWSKSGRREVHREATTLNSRDT